MKKVLNIILLFILGLGLISCDRMLKDPLEGGSRWGDVILNEENITIDNSLSITSGALYFPKAVVQIDGKKGTTGLTFKNIKADKYDISITVPSKDGKKLYSGSGTVTVKINELVAANIILDKESDNYDLKFTLTPEAYKKLRGDKEIEYSAIKNVYVVGDHSNWGTNKENFKLEKDTFGNWIGKFEIKEFSKNGFKFIFSDGNEEFWSTGEDNYAIIDTSKIFTVISSEKIKISLTSDTYSLIKKTTEFENITSVYVAGPHSNWNDNMSNYSLDSNKEGEFTIEQGSEIKFVVNGTEWTEGKNIRLVKIEKVDK